MYADDYVGKCVKLKSVSVSICVNGTLTRNGHIKLTYK